MSDRVLAGRQRTTGARIQDIDTGDSPLGRVGFIVLTHDAWGRPVPGVVDKLFTNTTQEFGRLSFDDGREDLVATPGHRFLTETGDYMEIGHMLRLGGGTVRLTDMDDSIVEANGQVIAYSAKTAHLCDEVAQITDRSNERKSVKCVTY